jgi:hypothetical protein
MHPSVFGWFFHAQFWCALAVSFLMGIANEKLKMRRERQVAMRRDAEVRWFGHEVANDH